MNPRVTILMPVHNGAAFLAEAIDSMLSQTLSDFEFLIVDDASTDASVSIIQGYRDPRIRLIPSRERLKLSGALNRGLGEARGTYVARMDADDISLPERLETQVRFLDTHPDVGLCGSWIRYCGASRGILERPTAHEAIRAFTLLDTPFAHPTVMLRREALEHHHLRFEGGYFPTEDFELWTRALDCFRAANLPQVLLHYRVHGSSLTGSDWSNMDEQAVRVIRRQLSPLGIAPTDEDLRFHRQLAMGRLVTSREVLDRAESWLTQIIEANRSQACFDPAALTRVLGDTWFRACMHTARQGFWVSDRYATSTLGRADVRLTRRSWLLKASALKGTFT